jgi:hypothetical protein
MKSLFPQEMLNGGELSLDVIKGKLHYFELQLHELHWQTKSLAEHLCLGDAYEAIFSAKDDIVEKIMGYTSTTTKAVSLAPIKNYSIGMPGTVIGELLLFAKQLENYGASNGMPDIENIAQSLSGDAAKFKYRLTLS